MYSQTDQTKDAEAAYKQALTTYEPPTHDRSDVTAEQNDRTAQTHGSLGRLYFQTGRTAEAEAAYRRALDICETLTRDHGDVTEYQEHLGAIQNDLGNLYINIDKIKNSEAAYNRAMAIQEALVRERPEVSAYRYALAMSHNNLGNVYRRTGRSPEAESEYKYALAFQLGAHIQLGAALAQPDRLAVLGPGVAADAHLASVVSSILAKLYRSYFPNEEVRGFENLLIMTRPVPPGASPRDGVELVRNTDYPSFLAAAAKAQEANDPKVVALRVKRPARQLDFSADERGFLVAVIHDFQLDVPVPPRKKGLGSMAGPSAKVYRITAKRVKLSISFALKPRTQTSPGGLTTKIESFDLGANPDTKVYALNDDETKPQELNVFTLLPCWASFGRGSRDERTMFR